MTTIEDITITGDDSQNVIGNIVERDLIIQQMKFVRGRPSMVIASEEIAERVDDYIPVDDHKRLVTLLGDEHAFLLVGARGAGAETTAIAVLRELRPGLPIRRFLASEDDLEEVRIGGARSYLGRASEERDTSQLRAFVEAVRDAGAYVVITGTEAEARHLRDVLPVVPVLPPAGQAVYVHYLERRGLGGSFWRDWARGHELLKDASPSEARQLAYLAQTIGKRDGSNELEVERAYLGWSDDLRAWFDRHRGDLLDQSLLIAAATITPADETSIYGAALLLARQLEMEPEGRGLVWRPSTALGELLNVTQEQDRYFFRKHGYAESVVRHVCAEYPLTRTDLLAWLAALPTDGSVELDPEVRHRIVAGFADIAAEYGAAGKITQTAGAWARGGQETADLAYVALARTCLHPNVGQQVRGKLLEWAKQSQAPQALKLTVVRICEIVGQAHLRVALVRLRHIASRGDTRVRDEVVDVAVSLAKIDRVRVFATALDWCRVAGLIGAADGGRLLDTAMLLFLRLLPTGTTSEIRAVMAQIDHLVSQGEPRFRPVLLGGALRLAQVHRASVMDLALTMSADRPGIGGATRLRSSFGTELFLALTVTVDATGLSTTLTGPSPVEPFACAPAWRRAIEARATAQGGFADFETAVNLWLDTAATRDDLRGDIVGSLAAAAEHDEAGRRVLVEMTRRWAGQERWRRPVKEALLVRLLLPEWHRLLMILWITLRDLAEHRPP